MSTITYFDEFSDKHHFYLVDLVRFLLGILLVVRGIELIDHRHLVSAIFDNNSWNLTYFFIALYVMSLYLFGGFLLSIGMLTRIVSWMTIPICIAEIFIVNLPQGFSVVNANLVYSIICLVLLIFFAFYGPGSLSVDHSFRIKGEE
jgi:putative oxidoreductase